MSNDLGSIAATVLASIGGLAGLLVVMTRLEPREPSTPAHQARHPHGPRVDGARQGSDLG